MTTRVAVLRRLSLDVMFCGGGGLFQWWAVVGGGDGVSGGGWCAVVQRSLWLLSATCGGEDEALDRVGCGWSFGLGLGWAEPFEVLGRPICC